jgi:biotin synthase
MSREALPPPSFYADRIIAGDENALGREDLIRYLSDECDVWDLIGAADRIRRHRFGQEVHLCSIVNAKQGGCTEDCGFCSQSKHFSTHVTPERFIAPETAVQASSQAMERGASALGMVAAIRGLEDDSKAMDLVVAQIKAVRDAGHVEAHGSLGFVSPSGFERLRNAGMTEYNHNLESSRRYYEKICSTHTYDQRIETVKAAKAAGLRTCCGGIIGMGEEIEDRADLALELRALEVDEVPLNFLVSIEGTKLAKAEPLAPLEMLRVVAAFRLALPRQNIFLAAGRNQLGHLLPLMFQAGASGMMIGDFLTTPNRSVDDDLAMLADLGLKARHCGAVRPELATKQKASKKNHVSLPVLSL